MLPSYESHYCRKETTKKYLPAHFTLKLVYDDYVEAVNDPVSITVYRKYFKQAGLKIKKTHVHSVTVLKYKFPTIFLQVKKRLLYL